MVNIDINNGNPQRSGINMVPLQYAPPPAEINGIFTPGVGSSDGNSV